MRIKDEARQEAARRWPTYPSVGFSGASDRQQAFIDGAVWASEQADREPSDAEVLAAKAVLDSVEYADEPQAIRAALTAAQEVRNHE